MIWRHARIVIKLYVAFCGASVLVLVCWENEFACWVKEFFLSLLLLFRAQLACHGWWWKWWIRSLRVHLQPRKRYAKTYILGKLNTTTTIFSWLLILPSCCLYSASCGLCRTWSSDKVLQPLKLSVIFSVEEFAELLHRQPMSTRMWVRPGKSYLKFIFWMSTTKYV